MLGMQLIEETVTHFGSYKGRLSHKSWVCFGEAILDRGEEKETNETRLRVVTFLGGSFPFSQSKLFHCMESVLKESRSEWFLSDTVQEISSFFHFHIRILVKPYHLVSEPKIMAP